MSNVIVSVSRPELTLEERNKRYAEIKAAATQLLLTTYSKRGKEDEDV